MQTSSIPALTPRMAKHIALLSKGVDRSKMDGRTLRALARRGLVRALKSGDYKLLAAGKRIGR